MSKAKVKERRTLKEEKREERKQKKSQPHKTPFKERHANIFKYFWVVWFAGVVIFLLIVLFQLYQMGRLDILIPKQRF